MNNYVSIRGDIWYASVLYYWDFYANLPEVIERKWRHRYVQGKVGQAVKNGMLPKAKTLICEYCHSKADQYHHPFYEVGKELEVIPLCIPCHRQEDTRLLHEFRSTLDIPSFHDFYHAVLSCYVFDD